MIRVRVPDSSCLLFRACAETSAKFSLCVSVLCQFGISACFASHQLVSNSWCAQRCAARARAAHANRHMPLHTRRRPLQTCVNRSQCRAWSPCSGCAGEANEHMADHAIEKKAPAPFSNAAGTDGGWVASKPLKTRYTSSTGITSFDGESAWDQYDPHILVPKEWGKQSENHQKSLRDWPEPDFAHTNKATWKHANTKRWPLLRQPKYNRSGVECSL